MNSLVFGVVYEENDSIWKWLQHAQEEGTKLIGVAGPINFLPFLRLVSVLLVLRSPPDVAGSEPAHQDKKQMF
jgi:ecdysteroid 25-hydroxylase CYP306A1